MHVGLGFAGRQQNDDAEREGDVALKLRASMLSLFSESPTIESVDEFLEAYDALLTNPVVLH